MQFLSKIKSYTDNCNVTNYKQVSGILSITFEFAKNNLIVSFWGQIFIHAKLFYV